MPPRSRESAASRRRREHRCGFGLHARAMFSQALLADRTNRGTKTAEGIDGHRFDWRLLFKHVDHGFDSEVGFVQLHEIGNGEWLERIRFSGNDDRAVPRLDVLNQLVEVDFHRSFFQLEVEVFFISLRSDYQVVAESNLMTSILGSWSRSG